MVECTKPRRQPMVILLLNPECDALFQYPKRNWRPCDQVWYENRPVGKNKLALFMKEISKEAGLTREYTNHSVRATAITLWANTGLTYLEIMTISGHRSEASLRSYHNQPSVEQLRKCSDVLSEALSDEQRVQSSEVQQRTPTRCPFQNLPCTNPTSINNISTTMAYQSRATATSTDYRNMFNTCSIGNINITFHK